MVGKYSKIGKKLRKRREDKSDSPSFDDLRDFSSMGGNSFKKKYGMQAFYAIGKKSNEVQKQDIQTYISNRKRAGRLGGLARARNFKLREETKDLTS
jgi:hypothetical protein